jgi:hypothetical protein
VSDCRHSTRHAVLDTRSRKASAANCLHVHLSPVASTNSVIPTNTPAWWDHTLNCLRVAGCDVAQCIERVIVLSIQNSLRNFLRQKCH